MSDFDPLLVKSGDIPLEGNLCDKCRFFHYSAEHCGLLNRHVRSSHYRLKECKEAFVTEEGK